MRSPIRVQAALAIAGVVATMMLPLGLASHSNRCASDDVGPECYCPEDVRVIELSNTLYLTLDEVNSDGYLLSWYLYAESNSVDGLQRHDAYCTTPGYAYDEIRDTILQSQHHINAWSREPPQGCFGPVLDSPRDAFGCALRSITLHEHGRDAALSPNVPTAGGDGP